MATTTVHLSIHCDSCIRVGGGRGFVIQHPVMKDRLVITAAHCLPFFPPAHSASYTEDRTYKNLLGRLRADKTTVWAECLFADPIADIAVLGCPDNQELYEQADAYEELLANIPALRISKPRNSRCWLLALNGRWFPTIRRAGNISYSLFIDSNLLRPGMSGSPILNDAGHAIGVVTIGSNQNDGWPQTVLVSHLPGWLLAGPKSQ